MEKLLVLSGVPYCDVAKWRSLETASNNFPLIVA